MLENRERLSGDIWVFDGQIILPGHGHDNFFACLLLVDLLDVLNSFGLFLYLFEHHCSELLNEYVEVKV